MSFRRKGPALNAAGPSTDPDSLTKTGVPTGSVNYRSTHHEHTQLRCTHNSITNNEQTQLPERQADFTDKCITFAHKECSVWKRVIRTHQLLGGIPAIRQFSVEPLFSIVQLLAVHNLQPGTERVRALANISRSALCCRSNETCAPIANPPNSAQLDSSHYHSPKLHLGLCSSVGMRRRTDIQTDTQTRATNIHFASSTTHAKCTYINSNQ